jgi:hypothetical protein
MNVRILSVPFDALPYPTAGDWRYENGELVIRVAQLGNEKFEALLAIHELIEALACGFEGITPLDVDRFDFAFEARCTKGKLPTGEDDPGSEPDAPYNRQHRLASGIEEILASVWGVNWKAYEKAIDDLPYPETWTPPKN